MIWRPYQYYARRSAGPAPAVVYPKNSDFPRFTDIPAVEDLAPADRAPRVWVVRHRDSRDRALRLLRLHQAIGQLQRARLHRALDIVLRRQRAQPLQEVLHRIGRLGGFQCRELGSIV